MRLDVAQRKGSNQQRRNGSPPEELHRSARKRQRPSVFSSLRLALMRLARGWELLLAVALGIVVAVVLVCTVPLYDTLVSDLQLQHAIHDNGTVARDIEATAQSALVSSTLRTQSSARVDGLGSQLLSPFVGAAHTYYAASDDVLLEAAGKRTYDVTSSRTPHVTFLAFDLASAAPHLRFVAGGPATSATSGIPVDITTEMAQDDGLTLGSRLRVTQFGGHDKTLTATVVGIFTPSDPNEAYWNGLTFAAGGSANQPKIYPVLMSYDVFFGQLSAFPLVGMTQHWVFYTQPESINTGNMASVRESIGQFRAHINGDILTIEGISNVGVQTALDQTIKNVQDQAALLALPLYVIVAQVVGLALLFVATMSGLLIESQTQDIATLKSRGASGVQLLSTFTLQGLFLALVAAVAGPFLAAVLGLALVNWFVPKSVLSGSGVHPSYFSAIANPAAVAIPAVVGALLGVGAVGYAALQSARLDVLAFRREQGRSVRVPLWRKYYLDVALAVLCGVGYLELGRFGGVDTRQQLGGTSASPLLLVAPALLLLAGALLVLRIFPIGAGLGARLASNGRGLTSLLALSQVERSPRRYSRITLLLVLAVGLGLFALTFDTSLQRNTHDRATYTVGSDIRVQQTFAEGGSRGSQIAGEMAAVPGVLGVTPVYRSQASTTPDQGSAPLDLLGIDPATWAQDAGAVSWRSDYAGDTLDTLMAGMSSHAGSPSPGTASAPIWAMVSDVFANQMHIKQGDSFTLQLSETPFGTTAFVAGAVIHEFPTLYPAREPGSFLVVNLNDVFAAIKLETPGQDDSLLGPNEFWLRTTQDPAQQAALAKDLSANANLDVNSVTSLSDVLARAQANPVGSGMQGLLIVGAVTAALLAVLGSVIQSLLAARQRATQFAVLRTVGMVGRQLTGLLLGEQIIVYAFGLVGGTLLGLLLVTATLPFLQFSDTTIDPTRLGIPSYQLVFNAPGTAIFYGSLVAAFALALAIAARYAMTIGLGKALRLGED